MSEVLTVAEVNALTGDDIEYWLTNPFMSPDLLVDKVCWWVTSAIEATTSPPNPSTSEGEL